MESKYRLISNRTLLENNITSVEHFDTITNYLLDGYKEPFNEFTNEILNFIEVIKPKIKELYKITFDVFYFDDAYKYNNKKILLEICSNDTDTIVILNIHTKYKDNNELITYELILDILHNISKMILDTETYINNMNTLSDSYYANAEYEDKNKSNRINESIELRCKTLALQLLIRDSYILDKVTQYKHDRIRNQNIDFIEYIFDDTNIQTDFLFLRLANMFNYNTEIVKIMTHKDYGNDYIIVKKQYTGLFSDMFYDHLKTLMTETPNYTNTNRFIG